MAKRKAECRYCGTIAHGKSCPYGSEGYHVETGDSEHCIYCGSTNYGTGCPYNFKEDSSRKKIHVHGHGDKKCIYCGSSAIGTGCPYSPDGKHHR